VVPGEELTSTQLALVPTTVLARVVVASEEERVRDLSPEAVGHVDVADESDHGGQRHDVILRAETPVRVPLQDLGLSVQDEAHGAARRNDRQGLE
jgi:hypothetical protein